jgi:predicted ATPase
LNLVLFERHELEGPLATYALEVDEENGRGIVRREVLRYRRGQHGKPWHFLDFRDGKGEAVTNEADYGTPTAEMRRETQALDSPDILAIKGLGQFQRFQVVRSIRRLIEAWHLSDFRVESGHYLPEAGFAEHLSPSGDNLPRVVAYLYQHQRERFDAVLARMRARVPGVSRVEAAQTIDGRLVLRFQDGAFTDPFLTRHVSDGTIKMFAYLVLLNDPQPHPLLCVEEPENQLYPALLPELAEEFATYGGHGTQVVVSTHSPDFLNAVDLDHIYWLEKRDGYSTVHRAREDTQLRALVEAGDLPGALWRQGLFGAVHP